MPLHLLLVYIFTYVGVVLLTYVSLGARMVRLGHPFSVVVTST